MLNNEWIYIQVGWYWGRVDLSMYFVYNSYSNWLIVIETFYFISLIPILNNYIHKTV